MHMYVRIQVTPFILPQKSVWPCTTAASPGLQSVKIKFYSPSSPPPLHPLTYDTHLILLHVAEASWETLHHSRTWGCVDSRRSPPLGQWVQSIHE